jgi:hypothetical protein
MENSHKFAKMKGTKPDARKITTNSAMDTELPYQQTSPYCFSRRIHYEIKFTLLARNRQRNK